MQDIFESDMGAIDSTNPFHLSAYPHDTDMTHFDDTQFNADPPQQPQPQLQHQHEFQHEAIDCHPAHIPFSIESTIESTMNSPQTTSTSAFSSRPYHAPPPLAHHYHHHHDHDDYNHYYHQQQQQQQEPVATWKIIKSLKITVHESTVNPTDIYYQIAIENSNNELLPEYITHLPGKGLSLSNTHSKQRIFVEQIYNDNIDARNELIYKYMNEMTSYHEKRQIEQCVVMPTIGKIANYDRKKTLIQEEEDEDCEQDTNHNNSNNRKRKQIKIEENDRPTKKRKFVANCIDLTRSESLVENENNDNKENWDEIGSDWDVFARKAKREQIDKLKENLLTYLDIKIEGDKCSHCNSRFSGEYGDGEWYKNGDIILCERCDIHQKNGILVSNTNDDYEGIIISNLVNNRNEETLYGRGKRKKKRKKNQNKHDIEDEDDGDGDIEDDDDGDWTPKTPIKSTKKGGKRKKRKKENKKMKKDKKESDDDEEREYALKAIHGKISINSNGNRYYLAEWDDFDLSHCSWEPMENFKDITINHFEEKIEKNGNTVCEKHRGYTMVPCFGCINNNNHGLKDLSCHGIQYKAKKVWFQSEHR